jgi:hypothetical protein
VSYQKSKYPLNLRPIFILILILIYSEILENTKNTKKSSEKMVYLMGIPNNNI